MKHVSLKRTLTTGESLLGVFLALLIPVLAAGQTSFWAAALLQ